MTMHEKTQMRKSNNMIKVGGESYRVRIILDNRNKYDMKSKDMSCPKLITDCVTGWKASS